MVGLGRTPFRDRWCGPDATGRAVIAAALTRLGLTEIAGRHRKLLSGGERQRTHMARALAQRPWCILLDEPTSHLDIKHQLELMDLLAGTDQDGAGRPARPVPGRPLLRPAGPHAPGTADRRRTTPGRTDPGPARRRVRGRR
ncbi:ABC transporter ATP-binding protein [Streptomyces sp. F001]|uniref:ATP-binding cassette domain-containing protein n=1 Tax=Streptomyces sp. F001 TaxID=1510026 RepID=UPI001F10FA19|nr:ABC transporter ATP-binding protein [Streptomyces sp. F001]